MTQQQLVQRPTQEEKQREIIRQETKREESFSSADITAIEDDHIDVSLTKEVFTAEASLIKDGDEEQKVMDFNEEEVEQQHSLTPESTIYEKFKASPWAVIEDVVEASEPRDMKTWEQSPWDMVRHLNLSLVDITVPETEQVVPLTVPVQPQEQGYVTDPSPSLDVTDHSVSALDADTAVYYQEDISEEPAVYGRQEDAVSYEYENPVDDIREHSIEDWLIASDTDQHYRITEGNDTGRHVPSFANVDTGEGYADATGTAEHDQEHRSESSYEDPAVERRQYDADATDHGVEEQFSYTVDDAGNAADVVESLFEETDLSGSVERMTYQDTEDNYETKESYWVEIDGMDMYRTEFFINGELADDSLDAYDLDAGDTLTFVEADLFDEDEDENTAAGGACGGDLYLDDVLEDAEDAAVFSTDHDTSPLDIAGGYGSGAPSVSSSPKTGYAEMPEPQYV